jgi:raffinose/stachyose/melibiose transport system permease protein
MRVGAGYQRLRNTAASVRAFFFLLRTYFLAIPREMEEAAVIDGANRWQVFYRVSLPLVSPPILTVGVISGLNTWNEFLISSTFLQSHDQQTAVVRFYALGGQYSSDWGEIMAAAILIVAPVLVFFLLMQRRFIEGMASGSVKG